MLRFPIGIAACVLLACLPAQAQAPMPTQAKTFEELVKSLETQVSEDAARDSIQRALKNIQRGMCEGNKPCPAATAQELAQPPISVAEGRAAMVFGLQSALAQWCGLDFKRGFLPMLAVAKRKANMNDRQMMLMSLIHGDFMTRQLKSYQDSGKCPAQLRAQLDTLLPKT
jgi:hypothetical protein